MRTFNPALSENMTVLRGVRPWGGAMTDVAISGTEIVSVGLGIPKGSEEIDGRGDVLLPGLRDHHLHILALAARRQSVDLSGLITERDVRNVLVNAPAGAWIRAVGYDEMAFGIPDAEQLDAWVPDRPLRLADRTGALRVLNSAALALLKGKDIPPGAERDSKGNLTGRFWREDQWLGNALPTSLPDLTRLGREVAAMGLTSLTDASAHNGPAEAALLVGKMPQNLILMGSEALGENDGFTLGPLKLMIDERKPPKLEDLAARIVSARQTGRAVAAHCVTEAELALYLAALDLANGARQGDRIEHGGLILSGMIEVIAATGLTVITNPAFLHDRGERYRTTIAQPGLDDLYRISSLLQAGITVLGGSDAPYADIDPWLGMRSARDRLTAAGSLLGEAERIEAMAALRLYCSGKIEAGAPADLILCEGDMADILADLSAERLRLTMIGGSVVHMRARTQTRRVRQVS